jgi:transcriptional regulator with XRE-family HTH domain
MMRKWVTLLLLVGTAWPATAAKSVSIEQLEQMLFTDHGKSDEKVAERLSDLVLTERVSPARLTKWEKEFPGKHAHEALMKLADEAAFLDPPEADVLRDPPPDNETQERMLALALDYVRTTIRRLPNFYATRETARFEDTPAQEVTSAGPATFGSEVRRGMRMPGLAMGRTDSKPLRLLDTTSETVTYRDGREVNEVPTGKSKKEDRPVTFLTTSGEFGPILGVVLSDAMRSQATWARWEQGASDPVAVFRYAVPEDASDYSVRIPDGGKYEEVHPAYHGEIAIDPATGAILRLSLMADLGWRYQMMRTAILVEYAPAEIGDRTYICPVHGVAFWKGPVAGAKAEPSGAAAEVQTQLNDVAFTHYHLFESQARIVRDGSGASAGSPPVPSEVPAAGAPSAGTGSSSGAPATDHGR